MHVEFIPLGEYSLLFEKTKQHAEMLGKTDFEDFLDDIDFASLALKLGTPIWSNDKVFKKVKVLNALTTSEMIKMLKSAG